MLTKILLKITRLLEVNKIPYMIIGGYAVLYYGEPRFTEDIDIVLGVDTDKLDEIIEITSDEFSARPEKVKEFVNQTNVLPLISKEGNVKVDLVFSFIEYERNAIQNAVSANIENAKVKIVRAEDLIIYKLLAGRPRDLEDAKNVVEQNIESINLKEIGNN